MRLINTKTLTLHEFMGSGDIPPYAILSHTWEDDEVTFQEFSEQPRPDAVKKKKGFAKIEATCRFARGSSRLEWAWVDTCCIDKTSSAELTEAINSMFRWYQESAVCFAYLDVPLAQRVARYAHCRWFTRGWTLQELIAPRRLWFYNADWVFQGEKEALSYELAAITKISRKIIRNGSLLSTVSVAQRMSWAAGRVTTRVEDMAYCLLGIFGVQLPLLYGEGEKAFIRLQEEIVKEINDLSLFAWTISENSSQKYWGVLAQSPRQFESCRDVELWGDPIFNSECVMTSKGLRVSPLPGQGLEETTSVSYRPSAYVLNLQCHRVGSRQSLGIYLRQHGCDMYTRINPHELAEPRQIEAESKNRTFYVSKVVSPIMSVALGASHRHAVVLNRAVYALIKVGYRLGQETGCYNPAGHWDVQQLMYLTQGAFNFSCRTVFSWTRGDKMAEDGGVLHLEFELEVGKPHVWFSTGKMKAKGRTIMKDVDGRAVHWFTAGAVQESLNGQPVWYVTVDVHDTVKKELQVVHRGPPSRGSRSPDSRSGGGSGV
ncbi:heterokaryon incompatibility protein-domain-containing protein [Bombardia bombarda]|uniref:Heterokaryon incompatibility protein-domain-containing protein n=1 Tax=Bombardia bombarda TaxID=252184 RepID=A0AA39W3U0_9PEZI|nr:heterokaryon incompatibility protein-domain-containing protein [Bombardia bombarda]